MISCTEFIPLYSEFFKYLEKLDGYGAVLKYWYYISDNSIGDKTNPNSLASKCEKYGGYMGARAYWGHTLTEEACDVKHFYDNKNKVTCSHMRHCPSRGMLNALTHIEPYHNYCEHCNVLYARILEKYGVVYKGDRSKSDRAECCSVYYEKDNPPDFDFRKLTDEDMDEMAKGENCEVVDMKSDDNKYLHRDFHLLGDTALKYCGDNFGAEAVDEFLRGYARCYFAPKIELFKKEGLSAIEKWLHDIYDVEEASDVIHTALSDNCLTVTIDKSPVIEYMHSLGQEPSEYYIEESRTLYDEIAKNSGFKFELEYYDKDGKEKYRFIKEN